MTYLTLLLILWTSSFGFTSEENSILTLGDTLKVPLSGAENIWIQDRKILRAEVQNGRVHLKGLTTGQSGAKIGARFYKIQVVHPHEKSQLQKVQKVLKNSIGLNSQFENGQLAIGGTLYRFKDWQTLATTAKKEGLQYLMKASIVNSARKDFEKFVHTLLQDAHLPPQTIIFDPTPEIRINASPLHTKKYEDLLLPYGVMLQIDKSHLDIKPTIKVEITVAEVKRNSALAYGLKWPQSYQANTLGGKQADQMESLIFEATAFEAAGLGKILASPNILCKSGEEAEFLAGGEFPIKIVKYRTQEILWKRYGILVKVKPLADASGRMSLSIDTEITTIDQSVAIEGIPGLQTNKVSSHFDITKSQVIALSGLLKNDYGKSSDGLPWLGQLPILGPLFSSKSYRENESELIIFVRPSIYQDSSFNKSPQHLSEIRQDDTPSNNL